jgi:hypothetical protein
MTGRDLGHREDGLSQYALPDDPLRPLLCCDQRPCQLLGEVLGPLPMHPGKPCRADDEYERQGTCCGFLAFEPHTGLRSVAVRQQRTAVDSAQCMKNLITKHYPQIEYIRLVQDNLNTHTPGSFYAG